MNNRITVIILSSVIVILVAFGIIYDRRMRADFGPYSGFRQHDHAGHRAAPGRNFCTPEFMRERLKLSDEQIEKINMLNETFDREHGLLMDKIEPERERLRETLKNDNPDMKQVRAILEKISAMNVDIQMLRINQGRIISGILTPEQQNMLNQERRRMFRRRGSGPEGME